MSKVEKKIHIPREKGIPEQFPLKCYRAVPTDFQPDAPFVLVGMDSGVGNTAFSYIELVQDPHTKAVIDFIYKDTYYFADELEKYSLQMDKQFFLMNKYYELFAHEYVLSLTYELLPLTAIKDENILKGVIAAQATTNMINTVAYSLNHPFIPVPATAIKYCLTGNGNATKEDMCKAAYQLTGDERLLTNDHMADAFAMCFYSFIQRVKEDCAFYKISAPTKFTNKMQ